MERERTQTVLLVALVVAVASLGALPGVAAADSRAGGTVVVEAGETVNGLQAFGGTVVVRGTVQGDLEGFAGSVVVAESGTVTGDVRAAAGSVAIAGHVGGNVEVAAGSVRLAESGVVDGNFEAGSGSVTVAGTVRGDARIGADTLILTDTATVQGSLTYDADEFVNGGQVAGAVTHDEGLDAGWGAAFELSLPGWAGSVWTLAMNVVLGAVLLALAPRFSESVRDRAATPEDAVRSGLVGLLALVGTPVALVVVAVTIVGIPFALVGILLYVLALWTGFVYGGYLLGDALLGLADTGAGRWAALVTGLVALVLAGFVPVLGGIVAFLTLLVGLGALVVALVQWRRRGDGGDGTATPDEAPTDGDESASPA